MEPVDSTLQSIDAYATVELAAKNMSASIIITAPENGGAPPSSETLLQALALRGVIQGIDAPRLLSLAEAPVYGVQIPIAAGREPQHGTDGSLIYQFDRNISHKPKEQPDGSVDYRDLSLVQNVMLDQVLVEKIPPTEGVPGCDVLGTPLPAKPGRNPVIPMGKNTKLTEDGLQLLAAASGHVEVIGGKVTVQDTFMVSGDVSTATGNINFVGSISVGGSVLSGYVVQATGSVSIRGACEAATIISGGNVTIGEGMNGGRIECVGDLKSKYLQSCEVSAGGNVYAGALIHCNLRSGGSLMMSGPKGTIMGGNYSAAVSVETMFLGSPNTYASTRVEVGLDPVAQTRLHQAPAELEKVVQFIGDLERLANLLQQYQAAGRLDADKAQQLQNALYTIEMQRLRKAELEQEIAELSGRVQETGRGSVVAKGTISPGVRIVIGPYQLGVNSPITRSKVVRGEDGLLVQPIF